MFNISAASLGYGVPSTVDIISDVRYWQIDRSGAANLTSATTRLYYDTLPVNDGVGDYTNLTVLKTIGAGIVWNDIGGTATANYTGSILSNSFSSFSRFTLANKKGGTNPLPIELVSFNAKLINDKVDLDWTSASEINNDYYTIERSLYGLLSDEV